MAGQDDDPDSWEDIDEEDLLRRLNNRQKKVSQQDKPKKVLLSEPKPDTSSVSQEPLLTDGPLKIKYSEGTEYVAPIKILKRPDKPISTGSDSPAAYKPQKSLAQREAEYNSARARILGDNNSNSSTDVKIVRQPNGPSTAKSFQNHPSS